MELALKLPKVLGLASLNRGLNRAFGTSQNVLLGVALAFLIFGSVPNVSIGEFEVVGFGVEAQACPDYVETACALIIGGTALFSVARVIVVAIMTGGWASPLVLPAAIVLMLAGTACTSICGIF